MASRSDAHDQTKVTRDRLRASGYEFCDKVARRCAVWYAAFGSHPDVENRGSWIDRNLDLTLDVLAFFGRKKDKRFWKNFKRNSIALLHFLMMAWWWVQFIDILALKNFARVFESMLDLLLENYMYKIFRCSS